MPRSTIQRVQAPGSYSTGVVVPWTAADPVNGSEFSASGKDIVLVRNVHASASASVTIESVDDPCGRSEHLQETIAAGVTKAYGPFGLIGWAQVSGKIQVSASSASIECAVVVLNG